ncbi:MAG: SAM-dependent methyltransferase [Bdellovibrionota bacterium]
MMDSTRTIHNTDALAWLESQSILEGCSTIASMPDISEFSTFSLDEWKTWFINAAKLILSKTPDDGICIFYQSDIKYEGAWVDKGYLCQKAAEQTGHELIAHKIISRATPGTPGFGRPLYSHMVCFSKGIRPDVALATPDVLPSAGESTWARGTGIEAARLACGFIKRHTKSHTIVNPFCGHGMILAAANEAGFNSVGIERSKKRAEKAGELTI